VRKAFSSPESTSPALINLAAFGAGSSVCATALDAPTVVATTITQAKRLPNRRLVMSIISVSGG
jgi:hypothetical protein